jgi:signal transduction histidine kinase
MSATHWSESSKDRQPAERSRLGAAVVRRLRVAFRLPPLPQLAAVSLAYFLLARLGVAVGIPPDGIAVFWPPNAIILCTFLLAPGTRWWAFMIGFLAAEIAGDLSAFTLYEALGFGIVNCLEGMLSAFVLRRLFRSDFRLSSSRELLYFVLVAIIAVPGIAALAGSAIYVLGGSAESYLVLWRTWWVGDAVGLVALAPFILTFWWQYQQGFSTLRVAYWLELALALSVLVAAIAGAFQLDWFIATDYYRIFYIYPVLVWIALRGGTLGAAAAGAIIASMVAWMATTGAIPVAAGRFEDIFFLQQFLVITVLSTLTLAVLVQEMAALNRELGRELERSRSEGEILRAKERAERANEAKTNFLAHMSHELRTPLNAILGFAGSMRHEVFGPLDNRRYREYVAYIEDSAEHLLSLINDIIDTSRIERGSLDLADDIVGPSDAIDHVFRMLQASAAKKRVALSNLSHPNLPSLRCDAVRLRQILINLVGNAVKFSAPDSPVEAFAHYEDGVLQFVVRDHGAGIPPDKLGSAFQRFQQFSKDPLVRAQGSGLGLHLSRALVEAHNGRISIDSALGKGTTVTVVFPAERVALPSTGLS